MKSHLAAAFAAIAICFLVSSSAHATSVFYGDRDRVVAVDTNSGYRRGTPPPLSPQELAILQKSAAHALGRHLDDYVFQGTGGLTPPRPGCKLDKRVREPNVPGLNHAGWICPVKQY